jgi:predicted MFS family arabinose efflux permease
LTSEEVRTKAMAIVGITIGLSFAAAIVIGPLLASVIGVSGIFWLTAGLAMVGIAITWLLVPNPQNAGRHRDTEAVPALFARVLSNTELLRLDFAIFALHAILTMSFLAVPALLTSSLHLSIHTDWIVYLPVLAVSVAFMIPAIIVAEKGGRMKEVYVAAIALLAASLVALAFGGSIGIVVVVALVAFFTAFNIMEAMLPSLVTKVAPAGAKGTATGIYSTAQFLGIFVGGAGGGLAFAAAGAKGVLIAAIIVALVWLAVAATMRRPGKYASRLVHVANLDRQKIDVLEAKLRAAPGVVEAVVAADEDVAYLKIDRARYDAEAVAAIVGV